MPKARKKERIAAPHFIWLLGQRHGIFVADGRSDKTDLGRHSSAPATGKQLCSC